MKHRRLALAALAALVLTGCSGSSSGSEKGLDDPAKKDIAMRLVSSAENSTLDWKAQYAYVEDIGDGRGYTAGIIGFCSGTGDLLRVVERYTAKRPGNALQEFLPALRAVNGSDSHEGLGEAFTDAWAEAAKDAAFRSAQDAERDSAYFGPAVERAEGDGLSALGQFIYYDAYVMHGYADAAGTVGFRTIRAQALAEADPPSEGGDEEEYLNAFLDARVAAIRKEPSHSDTSRVETAQRRFVREGRLQLETPLAWKVYGESFRIDGG
ncbi:chitosanase [Streptomyces sp. NE06-03E]|uniref:Chitosanase n=1 Tax=Streptomyces sp. gb1(2016) TaxID=1828321 RepID=A0A652KX23_9ACTN|nr:MULTISPECIES: chitosanase [unclassified Streptomyces]MDX3055529.1 chitosanase [Streptomyces sp. NE06-03E]TXS28126.1 chitosanase [Streptomyces sp. gb1(2016)]